MTAAEAALFITAEQQRHNEIMAMLTKFLEHPEPKQPPKGVPIMWKVKEAAEHTGLSYDYIRKLCIQKKIPAIKAGSKYLINADKLMEYLNQGEAI